jgi:hypothetical protein
MTLVDRNSVGSGSRTVPKSAEPLVDGSVAMASRLAAWDKGDLKNGKETSQGER